MLFVYIYIYIYIYIYTHILYTYIYIYIYMHNMYIYIYITHMTYVYTYYDIILCYLMLHYIIQRDIARPRRLRTVRLRHRLNGYLAQRIPRICIASSFRMCLNCEELKGMYPWRTRYPLSQVPIKPVPKHPRTSLCTGEPGLRRPPVARGNLAPRTQATTHTT